MESRITVGPGENQTVVTWANAEDTTACVYRKMTPDPNADHVWFAAANIFDALGWGEAWGQDPKSVQVRLCGYGTPDSPEE